MSTENKEEVPQFKIPVGGIFTAVISGLFMFWSAKTKKRAVTMEESKDYNHETIKNAADGDYCSLSGSVQPLKPGDFIKTKYGQKDTVLYYSNIVERVKVTTTSSHTVNQKTRNPRVEYRTNDRFEENNITEPEVTSVRFGLFDVVSKTNVELRCGASRFLGALQDYKHVLPQAQNQGININVNNSSTPVVGEVRTVVSTWELERHLPIEKLAEGDKPRRIATVFGTVRVEEGGNTVYLSDEQTSFAKPFIFGYGSRQGMIGDEKATSVVLSYIGIFTLVLAGLLGAYEIYGMPAALKEDTTW